MLFQERLGNILFGGSLIVWAALGMYAAFEKEQIGLVRSEVALLNLLVGILIIFRAPLKVNGGTKAVLISLPSLICGGALFKLAFPFSDWKWGAVIVFSIGCGLAIAAFLNLGKNFAILPQSRTVTTGGVFRLVRHPAYLGELLMCLGCVWARPSIWSLTLFLVVPVGLYFRIREEETLLSTSGINYKAYTQTTRWRLVPFVW